MLFVDESGTPPPANKVEQNPFFILGGVCIPEKYWKSVAISLDSLKEKYLVKEEIKWRNFSHSAHKNKNNGMRHLNDSERECFRDEIYEIIMKHPEIKIICIACNTYHAYKTAYMNNPEAIYMHCYKSLTERFQYYLQDISKNAGTIEYGIVVCDHRGSKDDEKLRVHLENLMNAQLSRTADYQNIIGGLFISPSHLSIGIQLSDMVAGATLRYFKNKDCRFIKKFIRSFRMSPRGEVEGFGVVKLPYKRW